MQLLYKFVLASAIFASSTVAKPAVANVDGQAYVCDNKELIKEDIGNCTVRRSLGILSLEECQKGVLVKPYYYCVINSSKTCRTLDQVPVGSTGGECFWT